MNSLTICSRSTLGKFFCALCAVVVLLVFACIALAGTTDAKPPQSPQSPTHLSPKKKMHIGGELGWYISNITIKLREDARAPSEEKMSDQEKVKLIARRGCLYSMVHDKTNMRAYRLSVEDCTWAINKGRAQANTFYCRAKSVTALTNSNTLSEGELGYSPRNDLKKALELKPGYEQALELMNSDAFKKAMQVFEARQNLKTTP